jgi:hypothetical protein
MIQRENFNLSVLSPLAQTWKTMSSKYIVMDTEKLVNTLLGLTSSGEAVFTLREIRNNRSQKKGVRGVHTVKLRMNRSYDFGNDVVYPELIIQNSHDGSSPLRVDFGLYRQICTNGLCVKMTDYGEIKIRHMGTPEEAAFDIVKEMAKHLPKIVRKHHEMANTILTEEQAIEFAMKAAQARWDREFTREDAQTLLIAARPEDEGQSLWCYFNIVQEKIINGGLKFEGQKRQAKAIVRGQEDVRINAAIWQTAESYIDYEMVEN